MTPSGEQGPSRSAADTPAGGVARTGPAGLAEEVGRMVPRLLVGAATVIVLLWFLHQVRVGVLLLLLALILSVLLNAPTTALEKRGLTRGVATLIVMAALLLVAGLLSWFVLPRLVREIPRFIDILPQLAADLMERVSSVAGESPELERQLSMVVSWALEYLRGLWRYLSTALEALLGAIVVLALVLFMLLDPRPLLSAYVRLLPEGRRDGAVQAFRRSSEMVVGWVAANAIVGGIRGAAAYAFLIWVGVPGALLWAILSFATALIPRIGFYLMTIPPVMVAAAESFQTALWTALFFTVLDNLLGNFVVPRIQGETMELHPAYILAVTVLMALAFGVIGVLIAAPVAGTIKAHVDEFYLKDRPEDPTTRAQVDAMLASELTRE